MIWNTRAHRHTTWQHAADIPRRHRGLFLARARRLDLPCEYGHFGCSDRDRGPCSDELLHLIDFEHRRPDTDPK